VGDYPNGWVQVGSVNTCVQYTILPDGGKGGKNDEAMAMVLDEIAQSKGQQVASAAGETAPPETEKPPPAPAAEEETPQQPKEETVEESHELDHDLVEETYKPVPAASTADEQPKEQAQAAEEKPQVQEAVPAAPAASSESAAPATPSKSKVDLASVLHNKYKPLWLSAREGWTGGSHSDAVEYCNSVRGKSLCPYSAMCPHGPGNTVMGGRHQLTFEVEGTQWAPVMGGENHWVMIGKDGDGSSRCKTHRQLQGRAPAWGLTSDNADMKRHVMCCTVE
jgi:hypothetical protein